MKMAISPMPRLQMSSITMKLSQKNFRRVNLKIKKNRKLKTKKNSRLLKKKEKKLKMEKMEKKKRRTTNEHLRE